MTKLRISRTRFPSGAPLFCLVSSEDFATLDDFVAELNDPEGDAEFAPLRAEKDTFRLVYLKVLAGERPKMPDGTPILAGNGAFYTAKRTPEGLFAVTEDPPMQFGDPLTFDEELVDPSEMIASRIKAKQQRLH